MALDTKMSTSYQQKYRSRGLKPILFAGFAAVLVWEVISRTFVAFLANVAPQQALHIRSQQSTALLGLAQKKVDALDNSNQVSGNVQERRSEANLGAAFPPDGFHDADRADAEDIEQARRMAEQALLSDPLNARALRILGQIAELSRDEPRSWQLMQASVRRSLNETLAVAWLTSKSAERRDYAAAMRYADVLLRTRPQVSNEVIPLLARLAENGEAVTGLKEMLSQNPPWRAQFFDALPNSITDARTPLDLLMAVKHSPVPPATAELRSYLNFLIGRKFYALAYYTWLHFLPPDQISAAGFVFNGGFETVPSGLPFDWSITPGAGATVEVDTVPDEGGNHALFARFEDSRVEFGAVVQLIVLAPATYRLEAVYKGTLLGQRGLKWRVTCVGGATRSIGESGMIMGMSSAWKPIEFSFAVPSSDCPAQYVRLDLDARMASEKFVSGEVWFDNLQISRVGDAEK